MKFIVGFLMGSIVTACWFLCFLVNMNWLIPAIALSIAGAIVLLNEITSNW